MDLESKYVTVIQSNPVVLDLDKLMLIGTITSMKVMMILIKMADAQLELRLVPSDRALICNQLAIWPQQLTEAIRKLKELGLVSGDRNGYRLNKDIVLNN